MTNYKLSECGKQMQPGTACGCNICTLQAAENRVEAAHREYLRAMEVRDAVVRSASDTVEVKIRIPRDISERFGECSEFMFWHQKSGAWIKAPMKVSP